MRKTLRPRFPDFFTDLEKKPTVLQSNRNCAEIAVHTCIQYGFGAGAKAIRHSVTIASVSRRSQPGFYLKTEASTYLLLYHKAPPSGLYHHAKTMGENGCNATKWVDQVYAK